MKTAFHSLFWTNTDPEVINLHKKIMQKFEINVQYTEQNINHGEWMNYVLNESKDDAIIFIDIDCFPLRRDVINETILYLENNYMVGNAQVTNCIKAKHDLFCAPSFLAITKDYYNKIGKPNAINNQRSDVAQEFTRAAIEKELKIKMYFPSSFQSVPSGGIWRLSSYGYYGIGTIFDDKTYHLFQTRFNKNVKLLKETAECILKDTPEAIDRKYNSRNEWFGKLQIEDDYGN